MPRVNPILYALAACALAAARAQDAAAPVALPPVAPAAPAGNWRSDYRLGPGDVLNLRLYGKADGIREQIAVAPDGTLTFLEARAVPVDGLSLNDARSAIEKELAAFYRAPRVILVPVAFRSKTYTLLGKVNKKGVYSMDQPITLVEAIARAEGIEVGLFEHRSIELADYARSFVVRGRERLPVDFEALFLRGDLSQNVELQPGDYINIASAISNDYYVLGSVASPGFQGFSNNATVLAAIANRGGFTERAFRKKVLVVRGSLTKPETFVVDMDAMLAGREPAFQLQPKDIVFVADRPWAAAEELLDRAMVTFLQSVASTWAGANVPVLISDPILPKTDVYEENQR